MSYITTIGELEIGDIFDFVGIKYVRVEDTQPNKFRVRQLKNDLEQFFTHPASKVKLLASTKTIPDDSVQG
jgi:hypothetical protein